MAKRPVPHRHYGKWRIRWINEWGTRSSRVFNTKRDAEDFLDEELLRVRKVNSGAERGIVTGRTFNDLADYWLKHRAPKKRSEKDDKSIIKCHLRPALRNKRLVEIGVELIYEFQAELKVGEKTVFNILTLLISMLNLAVSLRWLAVAPDIKKPLLIAGGAKYRFLKSSDEIVRFLSAARDAGEDVFAMYAFAVYSGMRAGELAGLEWENVNVERRLITVDRSYLGPTKGGYVRHVPIINKLLPIVEAWALRRPHDRLVFCNRAGTMIQPSSRIFQETLHKVLVAADFPGAIIGGEEQRYLRFHDLRHTFASHWVMSGGDLYKLMTICGWQSYSMVKRYAHLDPAAYVGDYDRMG